MIRHLGRRRFAALASVACVGAVFASGCGSSEKKETQSACSGSPASFSVITNLSTTTAGAQVSKDIVAGFRAAAAAINESCELGRPVKILACDDKFSPNGAAELRP